MLQKIKSKILILSSLLFLAVPMALPVAASADTITGGVCGGATSAGTATPITSGQSATDCSTATDTTGSFDSVLSKIINIFSIIVGVVAVIMLIVGGFRYITSGGSAEKVTAAKNTILYALIGLVIVALAQIIVKFVLSKATSA